MKSIVWSLTACLCFVASAHADVTLPNIFGPHMVLQAERSDVAVWGKAEKGEKVKVTFDGKSTEATAGDDGKWLARIATPKADNTARKLVLEGKNKIELDDVLVGEVWICSGQSNMEWSVAQSLNPKEEAEKANYPQIRLIKVQHNAAQEPQDDIKGAWTVCSPGTASNFSAVAYYFARHLNNELKVPIGLISTNWGGTICEAWTSNGALKAHPDLAHMADRKNFQVGNPNQPTVLYNGMINPIVPFGVRGAIWYQGESNLSRAEQYGKLFPAMIADWRKAFGQGDFPFYFVQIAPYKYNKQADTQQLPELWESQTGTLKVANTGMAVTHDIGNVNDIHPKNKQDVGRRLALWALAKDYGKKDLVYSGPLYESSAIEGNKVRVKFKHAAGGLEGKDGKPLTHFLISGDDKKWVEAKAEIDGETVLVSSDAVAKPVAVRFAWGDWVEPNLFNKAGLPANSFRTDNYPGITAGKK